MSFFKVERVIWSFLFFSFFKFLEDTCPSCGATGTPVLDFWWRLPWVSKPGWTRLHAFLPARYSSDSPLVRHMPTSWRPTWQPSHFDPHTCSHQTYPQALVALRSEPGLEPMAWAGARTHDLPCRSTAHLTTRPFRLGFLTIVLQPDEKPTSSTQMSQEILTEAAGSAN